MKKILLRQAIDHFIFAKQTENRSATTIHNYKLHLDRFEQFFLGRGSAPLLEEVTADDVREYVAYLQAKTTTCENHPFNPPRQRPLSPHTIHTLVVAVGVFFAWCTLQDMITRNPMDKIKKPKVPKVIKPRFSEEEITKLVECCKQYPPQLAARNKAIVFFLLSTGVRANELCTLTLDDFDRHHGHAKVRGKGAKDRYVYFKSSTALAVAQYVDIYRPDSAAPFIFLTQSGEPIRPDRLTAIMRDLGDRAGVPHCSPHRFRHTSVRLYFRYGAREFSMQKAMGHEDLQTTRGYAELEQVDVEEDIRRADPVDRLGLK